MQFLAYPGYLIGQTLSRIMPGLFLWEHRNCRRRHCKDGHQENKLGSSHVLRSDCCAMSCLAKGKFSMDVQPSHSVRTTIHKNPAAGTPSDPQRQQRDDRSFHRRNASDTGLFARLPRKAARLLPAGMLVLAGMLQPVQAQTDQKDPWEVINRPLYAFNSLFDGYLVRPVAVTYDTWVPELAKRGVRNFFNNLDDVNVVVNDLMQLKLRNALNDSGRLVLNTTVGMGGLIDVAANLGLYKNYEDFGQTLGYWGIGDGGYVVLPFLGASTFRDTAGLFADVMFNPIFWVTDSKIRTALYAADTVDTRQSFLAAETMITGDEYDFVRNAYLQRREYLVADGEVYDEFDDF